MCGAKGAFLIACCRAGAYVNQSNSSACATFSPSMDDTSIQLIVAEITLLLRGRGPGKIFQLSPTSLAIDFGLRDYGYLFVSVEPARPRLYLIKRRVRDLEKESQPLGQFGLTLRKEMAGTRVTSVEKHTNDRVVRVYLAGDDDLGESKTLILIAQLTGRSANLLLANGEGRIMQALRPTERIGELYGAPHSVKPHADQESPLLDQIRSGKFSSSSEAADEYFTTLISETARAARIKAARADLHRKISQQQRLLIRLQDDLQSHAGADREKMIGDLLLANLATAKRKGNRVTVIDYFSEDAAPLEVEIDENASLQEEATRRFKAYARSKRAAEQIESRLTIVKGEIVKLEETLSRFESNPESAGDLSPRPEPPRKSKPASPRIPGTRRYVSTDGWEILVGRTSQDNDFLTFKIARPNDLWLHAADYGGSHVVVRNATRKETPHRTLIEAAQLAAYFSQAKSNPQVDVHYTQRKFISKPKGAKPGLVRLQRFKNITVEPKQLLQRA